VRSNLQLAKDALSDRLKATLTPEIVDRFVGGTHTQRFTDNLFPTFTAAQLATLTEQVRAGSGGELTPSPSGKRPAHAPYSSAALAVNAFGRWLGAEPLLRVAGLGGFNEPLRVEAKAKIAYRGGTANLDVQLHAPGRVVGVESKLTETLDAHKPMAWRAPYKTREMRALLDERWGALLEESLAGRWWPGRLGIEQLIKHALALNSIYARSERHLVYCYWEPNDGAKVPEVAEHRDNLEELRTRLVGADPAFHALRYADLFDEWEGLPAPAWVTEHVGLLRQRYTLRLRAAPARVSGGG
jgi:hypothetical protein